MTEAKKRIVVIGATVSTLTILKGLIRNNSNVVGVLSLDESAARNVSGFSTPELSVFCDTAGIFFSRFVNINRPETIAMIRQMTPDLIFAVGFSQLIGKELLSIPTHGTVGFHPTALPAGRGRAPLAWLTYDGVEGAATFFAMEQGVDDGPILHQEPFSIDPDDHAENVMAKILDAANRALDNWIPALNRGEWNPVPQNELAASYTGIRRPEDGLINWDEPCSLTYARIRAASRPHPGAYSYIGGHKIIIWHARRATNLAWRGVPGRVLLVCPERGALVQAGEGLLWLQELEYEAATQTPVILKVGQRLGYVVEDEIFNLHNELELLRQELKKLKL